MKYSIQRNVSRASTEAIVTFCSQVVFYAVPLALGWLGGRNRLPAVCTGRA